MPLRIEVGPRDLAVGEVTVAQRFDRSKQQLGLDGVATATPGLLDDIQRRMLDDATRRDARTVDVSTVEEARGPPAEGFARIPWSTLGTDGEASLATSAITVRCLQRPDGSLPEHADDDLVALVARSY